MNSLQEVYSRPWKNYILMTVRENKPQENWIITSEIIDNQATQDLCKQVLNLLQITVVKWKSIKQKTMNSKKKKIMQNTVFMHACICLQ